MKEKPPVRINPLGKWEPVWVEAQIPDLIDFSSDDEVVAVIGDGGEEPFDSRTLVTKIEMPLNLKDGTLHTMQENVRRFSCF